MCGIDEVIKKCREESGWKDCSKCMFKNNPNECMFELKIIYKDNYVKK